MPVDRDAVVWAALALDGLSFGATRDRYVDALYPHDRRADAMGMGRGQSSCGGTCEAVLRAVGIDCPVPYVLSLTGKRLPWLVWQREEAKKRGAWVDARAWDASRQLPIAGDMVEIGPEAEGGAPALSHVLTIVGGERYACESVDGGQPDAANADPVRGPRPTAICRRLRHFDERPGQLWLVDDGTARARRVHGWIDASRL